MSNPVVVNIVNKPAPQISVKPGSASPAPSVKVMTQTKQIFLPSESSDAAFDVSRVSYRHRQIIPAGVWTIPHALGFKPAGIIVYDTSNEQWLPIISYTDDNNLQLSFGGAVFAGDAYLS